MWKKLVCYFALVSLCFNSSYQQSFLNSLGFSFGKIETLPDEDQSLEDDDTGPVLNFTLSEILKLSGYDTSILSTAVSKGDLSTLRQFRNFMRTKVAPVISTGCMFDMMYFADSLLEVALAQYDLSNVCVQSAVNSTANCSCASNVDETIRQNSWTLDVIDSFGKVPAGLLSGNFFMLGDYEECVQISIYKNSIKHKWNGQYCRVDMSMYGSKLSTNISSLFDKEFREHLLSSVDLAEGFAFPPVAKSECSQAYSLKVGTCFPKTCSSSDVKAIVDLALNLPQRLLGKRVICNVDIKCHEPLNITADIPALLLICFFVLIALMMILGTCYDYCVYQDMLNGLAESRIIVEKSSSNNLRIFRTTETPSELFTRQSWLIKALLAFSIYSNGQKIFDTTQKSGQIHCLHGIRVLSLLWVILGHTYQWATNYLDNPLKPLEMPKEFLNQIILNATICVDTFFLLSATLLAYLWLKEMKKRAGKFVLNWKMWIMFYVHRYIRLTPVYMLVIAIHVFLVRYFTDGPMWHQKGLDEHRCANSWWTNLLYINNFVWLPELCMSWSWYLANDMQFYVFSPPLLILLYKKEVLGIAIIVLLIFASSAVRVGIILWHVNWPPIGVMVADMEQIAIMLGDFWNDVYIKPYCRCGPFLIGLILGYILYKTEMKFKMPKWAGHVGWLLAAALAIGVLFGLFDYSKTGYISLAGKIIYGAFGRTLWAIALAWVIFACSTGYGNTVNDILSWKVWIPLSRLVYCAYLIHPLLIIGYYSSQNQPLHYSGQYIAVFVYFVHTSFAFLFALLFSLAFEVPIVGLEKIIFGDNLKRRTESTTVETRDLIENVETINKVVVESEEITETSQNFKM